jgi:hypothetical protein
MIISGMIIPEMIIPDILLIGREVAYMRSCPSATTVTPPTLSFTS